MRTENSVFKQGQETTAAEAAAVKGKLETTEEQLDGARDTISQLETERQELMDELTESKEL